jgi:hypothetical protein
VRVGVLLGVTVGPPGVGVTVAFPPVTTHEGRDTTGAGTPAKTLFLTMTPVGVGKPANFVYHRIPPTFCKVFPSNKLSWN